MRHCASHDALMESTRISVRLTPRASRDEVSGESDGVYLVRVTAPPVDGAANQALVRLISKRLGISKSAISIISGDTSRTKVLAIDGIDATELRERLLRG